ncbi:creatininase family protein [Haloarcula sp. CBA1130]|uniref:creatininase family protein n=1 Tax=unclassified Haloarcula TaxID=2624677 RepID=UPI001246249F|nr:MULTISPECIES: creatininase family protein [unclassified Haloarcula]KAA9395912.1 creatininase family protein [Haloarcula sp. CBA1129]KAA9400159.1 creatininase family protein [Haloarcula sp. CBA1130]
MLYETIGQKESEWAGMTSGQIRDIGDESGSVLVIPVGSVEQHGNHLPVVTDTLLVEAMVDTAIERLEDVPVVMTPPVWSGFSPHHLSFGGTLSLEFAHLRATLEDIAHAGIQNGFDAVLFVNGHGGNSALIDAVVSTVGVDTEAEVLGTTYFRLASDQIEELRTTDTGGMAHGGEFETSLMLALRPDLVGDPAVRDGEPMDEHYRWGGQDLLDGGNVAVYRSFDEYSSSGAIGSPKQATAETGERIRSVIGDELAALMVAIHETNA